MTDPSLISVLLMVRELGIGGSERQAVETACFMDRRVFAPEIGCFHSRGLRRSELDQAGVPVLELPVRSFKSLGALNGARLLIRHIKRNHVKIVHSFDAPLNVFGVPTARVAGAPVVISSQRAYRNLVSPGMRLLLRATDHIADAIVVNCQAMKHHLLYDEHVPESKIHVCYNGIDTERYQRKTTLSDSATPVIGVVSALRPEKGIDILLKAFASLHELEAKLLIVGSGPEESKLRAISADLGITSTCTFQPATSDVVNWLSQIDIFVLPSRSEALSNSLMEAMCCACCPIASRVGGNPELIDDGSTGLLFEVDDVEGLASLLREAVTTAMLRERLSEAASAKIVARFSKQQASATMERIYQTVLKTKT